jgi:LPS O-antigen subunit length determinant protein (WzzB/FepE family)
LINRGIDALNEVLGYEKQKIKAAQDEVDRLKNELNPPDVGSEKPDSKFQPYWEAKQKLERLEHFRDIVSQKISQMDDRNRSMSSPTSIVDRAQLPTSPIGPNRTLGKALLGVGGLLILCGFVVFVRNWRKPDAAES